MTRRPPRAQRAAYACLLAGSLLTAAGLAQAPLANAPVAPEALYLSFGGARPGIGVLDLNGYGQGTGDLATSSFPRNPNVGRPGVFPPLQPGTSSLDGGGAGALSLARNERGDDRLTAGLGLGRITDLQLGQPLDLVFNNDNINLNAGASNQINPATLRLQPGNTIMVAPHPNPPRLVLPPPNATRGIGGEEPTVTSSSGPAGTVTTQAPPCLPSPVNLLVPGTPGLFGAAFPGVFYGPQPPPAAPPPPPAFCPYTSRQQVGHFLYALDADNERVVVLNSNRFRELARFDLAGATDIAMAPDLGRLAVADRQGGVSFVATDPLGRHFHEVLGHVQIPGAGPIAHLAWQPEGEDLLLVEPGRGQLHLIHGRTLTLRKTVRTSLLRAPAQVAVSARQFRVGLNSWTYYALIRNGDGSVVVFESGPAYAGSGRVQLLLFGIDGARAVHVDAGSIAPAFWIAHQDARGNGRLARAELIGAPMGPRPDRLGITQFWQITWPFHGRLAGTDPVDFAVDEIVNTGGLPDARSAFVGGVPRARHSGKGIVKHFGAITAAATQPRLMTVAFRDTGTLQVLDLQSRQELMRVAAPDVVRVASYWQQ